MMFCTGLCRQRFTLRGLCRAAISGHWRRPEVDKVVHVDQGPIGRTPRSNPATYTGVFDHVRKLFAATEEAKVRGYMPGRFSFNVKGGRCEACSSDGTIKIEMNFLPDSVCAMRGVSRVLATTERTLEVTTKARPLQTSWTCRLKKGSSFRRGPGNRAPPADPGGRGPRIREAGSASSHPVWGEAQRVKTQRRAAEALHRSHDLCA